MTPFVVVMFTMPFVLTVAPIILLIAGTATVVMAFIKVVAGPIIPARVRVNAHSGRIIGHCLHIRRLFRLPRLLTEISAFCA
jgi:hypothetical protein